MSFSTRPLFGGALSCAIPDDFVDVSSFRQVPDNQEVFAHQATDQCVIVELLQYEDEVSDGQSARHFFDEIAGSNGCTPNDVAVLLTEPAADGRNGPTIDAPHSASLIVGDQRVAKFKESDDAKNVVRVYLGNIRLPDVTTDVVISVSAPMHLNPASSSYSADFQLETSADASAAIFRRVFTSFAVHEWSLFG